MNEELLANVSNNIDKIIICSGKYENIEELVSNICTTLNISPEDEKYISVAIKSSFISGYMTSLVSLMTNIYNKVHNENYTPSENEIKIYLKVSDIVTDMMNEIDK